MAGYSGRVRIHLNSILVLLEEAETFSPALQRAAALARESGARLSIVVVAHQSAIDAVGSINESIHQLARQAYVAEIQRQLQDHLDSLMAMQIQAEGQVVWGSPPQSVMLDRIARQMPNLVIKDIQLEHLLRQVVFTPTDWHLLRGCPVPLMLVNSKALPLPNRVLAAVEPQRAEHCEGHLNDRILAAGKQLATLANAGLEVAFVVQDFPQPIGLKTDKLSLLEASYETLRQQCIHRFRKFCFGRAVPLTQQSILYGKPWQALADHANDPAGDLLVLGTVQRNAIERLLLGSTAERVASLASCDLLAVPPQAEVSPG